MSSINIIQISAQKITKDTKMSFDDICEDELFKSWCDYGGEERSGDDLKNALRNIQADLLPFAKVNLQKKTISFKDKETVKAKWLEHVDKVYRQFVKSVKEGHTCTAEYVFRNGVSGLTTNDIYFNGSYCCGLSALIAEYLSGYLPGTLHIGSVLYGHI